MSRRYRRRNDTSLLVYLILGAFFLGALSLIAKVVTVVFTEYLWIVISIFVIAILSAIAFAANALITEHYKSKILYRNQFIDSLKSLNESFSFIAVDNLDLTQTYDNQNLFNDISEKDCLTYDLVYTSRRAMCAMENTKKNAAQFKVYHEKAFSLKNQMDAHFPEDILFKSKYKKIESNIFFANVLRPITIFAIRVTMVLTTVRGQALTSKSKTFSAQEVQEIIAKLKDKENGFYRDPEIWQSIARVERGKVTNKIRFMIYDRDGYRCRRCGSKSNLEIDHIFPIAKGGKTTLDNLQTLCHYCNAAKSDTLTKEQEEQYHQNYRQNSKCPLCQGNLVKRHGQNGDFYGCSNYPACKFTKNI